ncbi:hypothetical protein QRX60_06675 [Amycolatopsis mongoliensis]|uniref:Gram-positive cocci surface proteins LPxTG domain-containing protein n=1 Tax=Amycolatopsis mongoliensis TaxID=715475 RepID=A0A9Y2JTY8_9PSEU|nr:hypothetical protein [Amycolatopsis sp. 4-36]WIY03534.1 hypothetical protein QRX60_06675 [Amycolatopsis sp. 4-36]
MKKTAVVAGIATAFLVLAPGAALANTSPTTAPPPTTAGRVALPLSLSTAKALPGTTVKLAFGCRTQPGEKRYVRSVALTFGKPGTSDQWVTGTVKNLKPGKYAVTLHCGPETSTASLEVLPAGNPGTKQVTKVPAGAPQTGGPDGPAGGSGTPLEAAAAMGVLAVGGSGLVLARRARRR